MEQLLKNIELRPHQHMAVEKFRKQDAGAIMFGTGTGKTYTALAIYEAKRRMGLVKNFLVVCPKIVIDQWNEEFIKTALHPHEIIEFKKSYSGEKKQQILKDIDFKNGDNHMLAVNYESLQNLDLEELVDKRWFVVIDESHRAKELGTARKPNIATNIILHIGELTTHKLIMTATPTNKGAIDYYAPFRFLGIIDYSLKEFKKRYCVEELKTFPSCPYPVKVIVGYKNKEEFMHTIVENTVRKQTRHGDFPSVHKTFKIDTPPSYTKSKKSSMYEDIALDNLSKKRIALLTILGGLFVSRDDTGKIIKYDDNNNKINTLLEIINDTRGCISVFYQYNSDLEKITKAFDKKGIIYGEINGACKDRIKILDSGYDAILLQYQAGSTGLDGLQNVSNIMCFYGFPNSSILFRQATGRIDRIGQLKQCIYYYLITENTYESKLKKIIDSGAEYDQETFLRIIENDFQEE